MSWKEVKALMKDILNQPFGWQVVLTALLGVRLRRQGFSQESLEELWAQVKSEGKAHV